MMQLPDAPVTVHVLPVSSTAVTVYPSGVTPEVGAVTVIVARASPATAVGVPGVFGARKTEYTFLTNGVLAVPAKMKPSDSTIASLTLPPVALSYTNVLSSVPFVLNRLRFPLNDPPTITLPSVWTVTVSAPLGSAAAAAFVLNVVSSTPADENFFTLPVKSPTT